MATNFLVDYSKSLQTTGLQQHSILGAVGVSSWACCGWVEAEPSGEIQLLTELSSATTSPTLPLDIPQCCLTSVPSPDAPCPAVSYPWLPEVRPQRPQTELGAVKIAYCLILIHARITCKLVGFFQTVRL